MAVVDPGVGTERRPVAVETAGPAHLLVGPDNGLLSLAWRAAGGAVRAWIIASPDVVLAPISTTFHGRDVFAPAAARLAAGLDPDRLGPAVDPASLAEVEVPAPAVEPGRVDSEVLSVDRFGNLQLSARPEDLVAAGLGGELLRIISRGEPSLLRRATTFADVAEGEVGVIVDSAGWLSVVINRGSAAEALGLGAGDPVSLREA